jgi:hypothetical protein
VFRFEVWSDRRPTTTSLTAQVAALQRRKVAQLQARFAEVYSETTTARNRTWLVRRIAWRLQAIAEGGPRDCAKERDECSPTIVLKRFPNAP